MDIEAEAERPAEPELKKKRFEIEIEGEKLELVHLLLEQRKAARDLEKLEERELITQPKSLLRVSERNEYYLGWETACIFTQFKQCQDRRPSSRATLPSSTGLKGWMILSPLQKRVAPRLSEIIWNTMKLWS